MACFQNLFALLFDALEHSFFVVDKTQNLVMVPEVPSIEFTIILYSYLNRDNMLTCH